MSTAEKEMEGDQVWNFGNLGDKDNLGSQFEPNVMNGDVFYHPLYFVMKLWWEFFTILYPNCIKDETEK